MAINILIFISVGVILMLLRIRSFDKCRKKCGKPSFIVPKKTYFWHVFGLCSVYMFMLVAVLSNFSNKSSAVISDSLFAFGAGAVAGVCAVIIFIYCFTDVGIYENGILSHFVFISSDQIEKIEFASENSLNINSKIKTLKIHVKNQNFRAPNIEYLDRYEDDLRSALTNLKIQEM